MSAVGELAASRLTALLIVPSIITFIFYLLTGIRVSFLFKLIQFRIQILYK